MQQQAAQIQAREQAAPMTCLAQALAALLLIATSFVANCAFAEILEQCTEPKNVYWYGGGEEWPNYSLIELNSLDLSKRDARERTLLHQAVIASASPAILSKLAQSEELIGAADNNGASSLMYAIDLSKNKIAEQLLELGANVHLADADGNTALMLASKQPNIKLALTLLEKGALANRPNYAGNTPLHEAVKCSRNMLVEELIENGANANAATRDGITPLMLAANNHDETTVNILLQHGAAVNAKNSDGETALYFAAEHTEANIIKVLLGAGAYTAPLRDKEGKGILHALAENENAKAFDLLLSLNLDIDMRDRDGYTPLNHASSTKNNLAAAKFLKAGADPNATSNLDYSVLSAAVHRSAGLDHVQMLIDAGADASYLDYRGRNAIHYAAAKDIDSIEIIDLLIKAGANPNLLDASGKKPLRQAIYNRKFKNALYLILHSLTQPWPK